MNSKKEVQHVYLVGAKSLGAYGGYETFVYKLTEYHQNKENIKYHVACKANGDGCMDESKFEGVTKINNHEFELHNALHAAKVSKIPVRIFHAHGASITKDWKLPIKLVCKACVELAKTDVEAARKLAEKRKYQSEATVRSYQKMKADAEAGDPEAIARYEAHLAKRREEYHRKKGT